MVLTNFSPPRVQLLDFAGRCHSLEQLHSVLGMGRPSAGDRACLDRDPRAAVGEAELDVDDVLRLDELSESSLLCTLRTRFQRRQCFTWAGSILVFLNPRAWVPEVYDAEAEALHRSRRVGAGGSVPAPPPPHLFGVAEAALAALLRDGRSQHIVIGGESGAGKTESSKLVLAYLMGGGEAAGGKAAVVGGGGDSGGGGAAGGGLQGLLLQAGPLLEAFGNAQTVRNDNSSRFGKMLQLQIDGRAVSHTGLEPQTSRP